MDSLNKEFTDIVKIKKKNLTYQNIILIRLINRNIIDFLKMNYLTSSSSSFTFWNSVWWQYKSRNYNLKYRKKTL